MSFREKANLNSAQAFLSRSRSLYDGTKSTMRLSNITSKLRTVSETLANTNPFSSKSQDNNIVEENPSEAKQPGGIKKVKRRSCKRTTSRTESSTSTGGHDRKPEKKKKKKKQKHDDSEASRLAKNSNTQQTIEYVVQEGDSFNSVAARFDITPSELCRVNKFLSRTLFVGQVIKLPIHEDASNITDESSNKLIFSNEQIDLANNAKPVDSSQITTETSPDNILNPESSVSKEDSKSNLLQSGDSLTSSVNETDTDEQDLDDSSAYSEYTDYADEENDPMACQYLKFDCYFVVDLHCSVPGMILVTTNMFVFKPFDEKQYPLEHHCKQIPLNQFRTIAVYKDPSVMYFTKRGEQPSSGSTNVNIDNDVNNSLNSTFQMSSVIVDDTSDKEATPQISSIEKNSNEIEQKDVEDTVTADIQKRPLVSSIKKCDLDDNPYYLCILVSTNSLENNKHRRHPDWFTIQSEEYWFLIPNDKAKTLFDFLLTCQFHGYEDDIEPSTDMEVSQLSVKSAGTKDMNTNNTVASKFHSKSLGNLNFFKSPITSPVSKEPLYMEDGGSNTVSKSEKPTLRHHIHKHTPRRHNQYHFVVVPNTFDWILPRIGSPDDHSRALLILKNYQLERAQTSKESRGISYYQDDHSQLSELKETQSMQQSIESPSIKHTTDSAKSVDKYNSVPSMEEEKAALQLLKRETVDWELVSSKELELKELEEEKRKQFMFDCIKLAEPELLPIPTATSNSEIFDVHKVRDLLQNLNPDAEGLDWILTYSTSLHGFSLRSLYRQCANSSTEQSKDNLHNLMHTRMKHTHISNSSQASNQPCILIIRTSINEIFGAMLNTHPYPSSGRFYGNGSCFVFRWINSNGLEQNQLEEANPTDEHEPTSLPPNFNKLMNIPNVNTVISPSTLSNLGCDISLTDCENVTKELANLFYSDEKEVSEQSNKQTFQKFIWSGKNSYFINSGYDSLTIGCSQGHSAIQLDDVLLHGHSDNCETFDSPQLSSSPDFVITTLEIWSFI
ncbi:hypothetical protein MN116_002890 [Schistosoma mekongi]|uniref:Oxidation resistance protein 1 n=1 Tax=Schistosoma mekongi TaxID=38744 RepID=A0AAE2D823_SCHME|nr:hypothetical protein MN116_002890 [Schistosoma mekongi]